MRTLYLASVWLLLLGLLLPSATQAHLPLNTAPTSNVASALLSKEGTRETKRVQRLTKRLKRKLNKIQQKWLSDLPEGCSKIVLKNGEIIEANVIQITPDAVKYKRCGKPGDPEIVVRKAEVLSVIAEDGGFLFRNTGNNAGGTGNVNTSSGGGGGQIDGLAIASISAAGGALIFSFIIGILGLLAAIAAVVLGIISLNKIKKSGGTLRGKGLALGGIIGGGVVLLLTLVAIAILV